MPAVSTPLPAALAPHTVESLHALHGARRPWTYWIALAGTIGALASLPLISVDVSVSAPGIVRPATERVELRLPLGGRVAAVLARDNERVSAGQPLLELTTPNLDERLVRNAALQREEQAVVALLDTLSTASADPVTLQLSDAAGAMDSLAAVRAPMAGTVRGLVGLSPGAHLSASTVAGAISPDDRLLVESLVSTHDIGLDVYAVPGTDQTLSIQIDN